MSARFESRWRPYPAYADSGVEWLGEIPSHWERASLKWLLVSLKDGTHGSFDRVSEGIPLLSAKNVGNGILIISDSESLISYEDYEEINKNGYLRIGDLLLTIVGTIGRAAVFDWEEPVAFQRSVAVLRFHHEYSVEFYFYLTQSGYFQKYLTANSKQSAQGGVYLSDLATVPSVIPPEEEQRAIAAFLDRETTKIDALIAKMQRLIDLLDERRAALISHAVTKGLDPSVPMRDSGIAWLGDIPAHWGVKRIKHITRIFRGKFTHRPRNDPKLYDGPYPFIQTGDVANAGKYITEYHQTLNEEGLAVSEQFPSGTLVMTIAANIGDLAILSFPACFPDSVVGFSPSEATDLNFLYHSLTSLKADMETTAVQNTQLNLNVERIGNRQMAFPPRSEQIEIADYLDEQIDKIQDLIVEIGRAIDKLQEYRTALISAAVTGKIDVREEV